MNCCIRILSKSASMSVNLFIGAVFLKIETYIKNYIYVYKVMAYRRIFNHTHKIIPKKPETEITGLKSDIHACEITKPVDVLEKKEQTPNKNIKDAPLLGKGGLIGKGGLLALAVDSVCKIITCS